MSDLRISKELHSVRSAEGDTREASSKGTDFFSASASGIYEISSGAHRLVFELTLALYRITDLFPRDEALRKQLREKANEIFGGVTEWVAMGASDKEVGNILGRIETIKGFLSIARSMRFVQPINIIVLEREYDRFADIAASTLKKGGTDHSGAKSGTAARRYIAPSESQMQQHQAVESPMEQKLAHDPFYSKTQNMVDARNTEQEPNANDFDKQRKQANTVNERQQAILEHLKQAQFAKISDLFVFFSNISSKTIQRDLQDLVNKNMLRKEGEKRWTRYYINVL